MEQLAVLATLEARESVAEMLSFWKNLCSKILHSDLIYQHSTPDPAWKGLSQDIDVFKKLPQNRPTFLDMDQYSISFSTYGHVEKTTGKLSYLLTIVRSGGDLMENERRAKHRTLGSPTLREMEWAIRVRYTFTLAHILLLNCCRGNYICDILMPNIFSYRFRNEKLPSQSKLFSCFIDCQV